MKTKVSKNSLSDTELRKYIVNDSLADASAVNLGNCSDSHFNIRGRRIGRQSCLVSRNGSVYKTEASAQRTMLACRGYDSIFTSAY